MSDELGNSLNILIHGAINSSNFGDVLFAHIFYKVLNTDQNIVPLFLSEGRYGISDFNRKELNYSKNISFSDSLKADVLVYMSGGYFGDDKKSLKASLRRYIRYFLLGIKFVKRKKPIIIVGIGGGPLYGKLCLNAAKRIMNHASFISVRDNLTKDYFICEGVKKQILVTADTALTIESFSVPKLDPTISNEIFNAIGEKKILLVHIPNTVDGDKSVLEKIIPAVNLFIEKNQDYGVIVCRDCQAYTNIEFSDCFRHIRTQYKYPYDYYSAFQLCALLNRVDLIVTPKLHVGIVGSTFGKSVISVPLHSSKTKRFFNQINESDRCIQMTEATVDRVYRMMEYFKDKSIEIPDAVKKDAEKNLDILRNIRKYI